ncbi:MAG: GIY-YIG nuclease family protein [Saonia sp.]
MTVNVDTRINRHNKGRERTTKPYIPFRLIYAEKCENRIEARKREERSIGNLVLVKNSSEN